MPEAIKPKTGLKEGRKNNLDLIKLSKFKTHFYAMDDFMRDAQVSVNKDKNSAFSKSFNKLLAKEYKTLTIAFTSFRKQLKIFLNTKSLKIPAKIKGAYKRLDTMKKAFEVKFKKMERKYRIEEERKAKAEYKETSIEGIKFRSWKKKDIEGFSKFVSEKASSGALVKKLLKENKYLWNPKGNPELYFQQQCVEVSVLLLIHYCYKNKINIALPAGGTHLALSNYNTIEEFMGELYPRLSASHMFSGAGGIIKEIPKDQVKPGDIYAAKHPKGGFHAQLVISNNKGRMQYLSGDQLNKDFRKWPRVRRKTEKMYPLGFVKAQPNAKSKDVQMRYGGYGAMPIIKDNLGGRMFEIQGLSKPKDTIKYYRVDPTKMNAMISRIAKK